MKRTDDEWRELARATDLGYVDDRAEVKPAIEGDGVWVQIWLWFPTEKADDV